MILRNKKTYNNDCIKPLTINDFKNNTSYINNGLYYGYPLCCVSFFIHNCIDGRSREIVSSRTYNEQLDGSGFIPCDLCHSKIVGGLDINKFLESRKHYKLFSTSRTSKTL